MIIFTAFLDFLQSLSSVSFSAAVLNLTLEFNNKFCAYVSFQLDISTIWSTRAFTNCKPRLVEFLKSISSGKPFPLSAKTSVKCSHVLDLDRELLRYGLLEEEISFETLFPFSSLSPSLKSEM
jgi:hypothetical protein